MNNNPIEEFKKERQVRVGQYPKTAMAKHAAAFLEESAKEKYSYNFDWLGRPIIQYPQDIVVLQELIWTVKPDLIIETGIAHGGSLIFSASILAMIEYTQALETGEMLDPQNPKSQVFAVDIDIREHNGKAIENHPMSNRINMYQGSSTAPEIVERAREAAANAKKVMVFLDSNHTHDHVLEELRCYAPLTSKGSYCVVLDTLIEDMPEETYPDRNWGPGNSPKSAIREYQQEILSKNLLGLDGQPLNFEANKEIDSKILISVGPDGYLKRN